MTLPRERPRREEARTFWAGPPLTAYEELSLRSFIDAGVRVFLYTNNMKLRVPDGVELIDVREIISEQIRQVAYQDGDISITPYSDLFRYAAIERYGGWYFDLDIILNKPHMPQVDVYLARESDALVNAAVMKFPIHSPFMVQALSKARRLWSQAGRLTVGPELVTQLVDEQGLGKEIRPRSSAYEIGTGEILAMFDPRSCEELERRVSDSDFIHLWNEVWRRIRIPKTYGPPRGSFLDGLFQRLGMQFSADARMSVDAIRNWIRERMIIAQVEAHGTPTFKKKQSPLMPAASPRCAFKAETVRTLWGGFALSAYHQLALRSFIDRGHTVEVFAYDDPVVLPRWIKVRDASEILSSDQAMRYAAEHEQFEINADLFRASVLKKLGGWWIDPDVVLLADAPPDVASFVSGPDGFGGISTAAIKCAVGADPMAATLVPADNTSPVSWFDVALLFDPAAADDLERSLADKPFLDLHMDVWLRAGIPLYLGPPSGSYLDRLFTRYNTGVLFAEEMTFTDVRRWLAHMYACVGVGAAG